MSKKFILNADDFGMDKYHNRAVLLAFNAGNLSGASLLVNFKDAFLEAVNEIIPKCSGLGIGVHLNIMEGKSLTNPSLLTDENGYFNKSYLYLLLNQANPVLLSQIEDEFRAQILLAKKYANIVHIDSHVHVHAIPSIFKIVCRLAMVYKIHYVRTQYENLYFVPEKGLSVKYFINLIKVLLLNFFTLINRNSLNGFGLISNDSIIGVGYTGMMDIFALKGGLSASKNNKIVEGVIHPANYDDGEISPRETEFRLTQKEHLKEEIQKLGFILGDYSLL